MISIGLVFCQKTDVCNYFNLFTLTSKEDKCNAMQLSGDLCFCDCNVCDGRTIELWEAGCWATYNHASSDCNVCELKRLCDGERVKETGGAGM